jgi:cytosine/adenosine deaminase-related metal-dependent hydrolase
VVNDGAQRGAAVTGRTAKEMQRLQAALTYVDGRFQPNVQIGLDSDGRITRIGPDLGTPVEQLNDVALIPGLINVHSHAFQRALRGRGEHLPARAISGIGARRCTRWLSRSRQTALARSAAMRSARCWVRV